MGVGNYHRNAFIKGLSHTTSNKSYLSDLLKFFGQKFQLKFENFADTCACIACTYENKNLNLCRANSQFSNKFNLLKISKIYFSK